MQGEVRICRLRLAPCWCRCLGIQGQCLEVKPVRDCAAVRELCGNESWPDSVRDLCGRKSHPPPTRHRPPGDAHDYA